MPGLLKHLAHPALAMNQGPGLLASPQMPAHEQQAGQNPGHRPDPWPDRLSMLSQFLVDFGAGMSRAGAGGYNTMGGIGIGLAQAAKAANQRRHAQLLAALIRGDFNRPQSNELSQMMMSEKLRPPTPAPVAPQTLSEALLAPTAPPAAHGMGRHFPDSPPLAAPPRGPMLRADWRVGR